MARPSEIIKTLLAVNPPVIAALPTADWGANISKLLSSPVRTIALFDTGGTNPNPAIQLDYQTVQVQVRGNANDNAATQQKAQDIKDRLLGIPSQDVLGDRMISLTMIGDITFMGRDANDYPMYSLNFRMIKESAVAPLSNRIAV